MQNASGLIEAAKQLAKDADLCAFSHPVAFVYNPLAYAWGPFSRYTELYGATAKRVLFLGMNPGPWGMAQTGIPFGEIDHVKRWLGIEGAVFAPRREHPKRRVTGFSCGRSEVSGRRLWSLFAEEFGSPEAFFAEHFVANYCPLMFVEESGRNRTPDKLPACERDPLFAVCDQHLVGILENLKPQWLIGIGAFAEKRLTLIATAQNARLAGLQFRIGRIPHPSPANPTANRDWKTAAKQQLKDLGVW